MKVVVFDDKLYFAFNETLMVVDGTTNVVADAMVFDLNIKPLVAQPDQYLVQDDLNDFREALGIPKVAVEEEEEEEEDEDEEK